MASPSSVASRRSGGSEGCSKLEKKRTNQTSTLNSDSKQIDTKARRVRQDGNTTRNYERPQSIRYYFVLQPEHKFGLLAIIQCNDLKRVPFIGKIHPRIILCHHCNQKSNIDNSSCNPEF